MRVCREMFCVECRHRPLIWCFLISIQTLLPLNSSSVLSLLSFLSFFLLVHFIFLSLRIHLHSLLRFHLYSVFLDLLLMRQTQHVPHSHYRDRTEEKKRRDDEIEGTRMKIESTERKKIVQTQNSTVEGRL